ncbi:unnamed protein product, partial [Chrysodeixis includens]
SVLFSDRLNTFKAISKEAIEKGGLISHWQGNKLYIVAADPAFAEHLLKTCLEKDDSVRFFRTLLQDGSIFAPVPIWRPRRKILAPTFSPKNLNAFVKVFAQQSGILADQLKTVVGKGAFSAWKFMTTYTMDSVCQTTLGIHTNSQLQPEQPFLQAFEDCTRIDAKRVCQPWLYNDTVYQHFCNKEYQLQTHSINVMWSFMDQVIQSKRDALQKECLESNKNQTPKDNMKTFLELLIEAASGDKGYSNMELREETLVLVLAGTDTSAVGAAFTLMMLAKHPDVQDKVYEELQEIFEGSETVTAEHLPHLKYLDAVIRETLRLYPPVPFIVRKVTKDVTLPSSVTVVEGCGLFISIWGIHRNPRYWGDDAEQFRPERFLEPLQHPAAFMPFSHGPRACLGYQYAMMSMKTALATVLRRYRVLPSDEKSTAGELRVSFDIMMKDVDNFKIQLAMR